MDRVRQGAVGKALSVALSVVVALGLVPVAAFAESDGAVTVDGVSYTLAEATYEGTGDYASTWSVFGSMVYKYFGYDVYASEQLSDGTYNVVVYFGGESGYSSAIEDITVYDSADYEGSGTTVSQSSLSAFSSDPVYVINVPSLDDPIYCSLYVGGSMGLSVTYALTVEVAEDDGDDDDADEEDADSSDDEATDADDADEDDGSSDDTTSGSSSSSSSSSSSTSSSATDSNGLKIGATYSVPVTYVGTGSFASGVLNTTLQNMVSQYFGYNVYVTPLSDGTYDVVVYFGGTSGYSSSVGDLTYGGTAISQASDTTYTINVPSVTKAISLSLYVGGAMNMTVTYDMTLDVSSATLVSDVDDDAATVDKSALKSLLKIAKKLTRGSKTASAWKALKKAIASAQAVYDDDDATQAQVSKAVSALSSAIDTFNNSSEATSSSSSSSSSATEEGWQVGHTYEVPMTFLKHDGTETSMSAQYFGDTALVYVNSDGTLRVTFAATDEGVEQVTAISYNGTAITQSGNQFTFTIPASDADVAIPLGMTIKAMTLLGVGEQTTDLYLYLTQAVDLGSGLEDMEASSSNATTLADAGDDAPGAAACVACLAATCLALAARRRRTA